MYDLIIKNGTIINGTGSPSETGNLAVTGGIVSVIGEVSDEQANLTINAEGKIVCPGFIDIHGHSDILLLADPAASSKVMQGVTTEVCGNCGFSEFPVYGQTGKALNDKSETFGITIDWKDLEGFANRVNDNGCAINW